MMRAPDAITPSISSFDNEKGLNLGIFHTLLQQRQLAFYQPMPEIDLNLNCKTIVYGRRIF